MSFNELRKNAEVLLNTETNPPEVPQDHDNLLHELRTHQIELELQNEELRETQKELLDSRDKYLDLYDYAPVGYVSLDKNGSIVDVNLTFANFLERQRRALLGKKLNSFILPEHQDIFYQQLKNTQKNKDDKNAQLQVMGKNNRPIWVNISCLFMAKSSSPSFRLVITEIEDLKRTEKQLHESEERFRLALDATSDGVFDRNLSSGSVYYGENWARNFGYSPDDIDRKGITWGSLLHPDDQKQAMEAVQQHLDGQTASYKAEFRMRHKNGQWKWVQARGKVVERDKNNKPVRFVGVHTDITLKKHLEVKLRESELLFRTLAELSPVGIYLTDPQGECLYVNKCWRKMGGLILKEAKGQGWVKAIHPDDRQMVFEAWQKMVETGGIFAQEYRFLNPDGKTTWVYGLAKSLEDEGGNCTGYVGINADISQKKQAEIEQQFSFARLEELVRQRTHALLEKNIELQKEAKVRARIEQQLRKSEKELREEKLNLEETNTALSVLLKKVKEERRHLEEQMMINVSQLVKPLLANMQKDLLSNRQKVNLDLLEANLERITSPFLRNISTLSLRLSPMEIKVANLVREGKTSKEIAADFNLSMDTINIHRKNIRKKIGICGKNRNLRSMLVSLEAR